jgi:Transposase DDE domain group 1
LRVGALKRVTLFCDNKLPDSTDSPIQKEGKAKAMGFGGAGRRRIVADFDGGASSQDGALLIAETDKASALIGRFWSCFRYARKMVLLSCDLEALVAHRGYNLTLGFEDLIDYDELRCDPVLCVLLNKLDGAKAEPDPLVGKSTLNGLEHASREAFERDACIDVRPRGAGSGLLTPGLRRSAKFQGRIMGDIM